MRRGWDADINIFDPAQIHTRATYQDPAQFSDGLDTVFVSGQPAILARRADRPQGRHGPDPVNAPADMPGGRNFRAIGGPVSGFGKL